jgi:multimeric flavodoxin WrbA
VRDAMNSIYPRFTAAHGVMFVAPVNWYQVPSPLKLLIDRLVCADGGNPDPTSTGGKDPKRAKALELSGWDYPKHLAGARSPSSFTATRRASRICAAFCAIG